MAKDYRLWRFCEQYIMYMYVGKERICLLMVFVCEIYMHMTSECKQVYSLAYAKTATAHCEAFCYINKKYR